LAAMLGEDARRSMGEARHSIGKRSPLLAVLEYSVSIPCDDSYYIRAYRKNPSG